MIQVLLIILAYIVGPIAILTWAIKRYKHGIKPSFGETTVVVIAILLMVLFAFSSTWNISDRDADQADRIVNDLVSVYEFPVKARYLDQPAVFGYARPHRLEIHIYGILTREEQDKVVEIVRKLRRQFASKPVVVHFMREEIWEEQADGSRKPRRDREELIRKARID
ncbi:hypothetical protein [Kaarinaea lacus]